MKRKILVITERRADYTKFRPVLYEIKKSSKLDYFLIVTGSHLLKEFGYTINEIEKDGFKIKAKFDMYSTQRKDTGAEMARSLGKSIIHLANFVEKIKPDIIFSGMDVGTNLAAAIVGAHENIVVTHYEGGEVTGTIDESIRHATSKFAHIHFTTNSYATRRLIRMGEDPKSIYTVGTPSLDAIRNVKEISAKKLNDEFKIDFKKPFIIIMQHTVTSELNVNYNHIMETINAVKELDIQAISILGNADAGAEKISNALKKSRISQYATLDFPVYINLLKRSNALVGNSSGGIMEAPFLGIPSVNIGTRQRGRPRALSVIDVDYNKNEIKKAIKKTIDNKSFLKKIQGQKTYYGDGNASKRILKILEKMNVKKISIQKKLSY